MKTYRVDFKPISPYFFGNEKTFPYTGQTVGQRLSNAYYIKSERMPSQTTILGALRYLFLAHKKSDYTYTEAEFSENALRVGAESFDIARETEQDFGIIHRVSPLYLYHKEKGLLIPTPFDHDARSKTGAYGPFASYAATETPDGIKLYAKDYDVKTGLTDSFMSLDGKLVPSDDIFSFVDRVGIAIDKTEKAFFKKKYAMLQKGYSFSVYLELSDDGAVDQLGHAVSVFMGQGKSVFTVSFTEEEAPKDESFTTALVKRALPEHIEGEVLYFVSDAVIAKSGALYDKTLFSVVKTKDYRAFGITYTDAERGKRGGFRKEETLYKLIAAGSILITANADAVLALFENPNAKKIGLNHIVK